MHIFNYADTVFRIEDQVKDLLNTVISLNLTTKKEEYFWFSQKKLKAVKFSANHNRHNEYSIKDLYNVLDPDLVNELSRVASTYFGYQL